MGREVQPKVEYKVITPEIAQVLLARSKRKNVPIKEMKVRQYASMMAAGRWDKHNSQAVSIDVMQDIVNGHQRLLACVRAGRAFETLFITGVPVDTFKTEDTGRARDASHYFAALGEPNYIQLAAAARSLYLWERGLWKWAPSTNAPNVLITNDDLRDEVERRPFLRDAAKYAAYTKKEYIGRLTSGMVGALYTLTSGHKEHANFWRELVDRLSDKPESPVYQLNRRIDNAKREQSRLSPFSVYALVTKAWNMYILGPDKWIRLQFMPGKEQMPEVTTKLKPALVPPPTPPANAAQQTSESTATVKANGHRASKPKVAA